MRRPLTIRASLLRNLIVGIVLLSAALIGATSIWTYQVVGTLSTSVMQQAAEKTDARLKHFFDPVEHSLRMIRSMGEQGLLDLSETEQVNQICLPLLDELPWISSVLIGDALGNEYTLVRLADGWRSRTIAPDIHPGQAFVIRWHKDGNGGNQIARMEVIDSIPFDRPWFDGAMEQLRMEIRQPNPTGVTRRVAWSQPYEIPATGEIGITASLAIRCPDGVLRVCAFDISLRDMSRFSDEVNVTANGMAFILTEDLRLIGVPLQSTYLNNEQLESVILRRPEDVDIPLVRDTAAVITPEMVEQFEPVRYRSGGQTFWTLVKELRLSDTRHLWIAVVVPENDLLTEWWYLRSTILLVTLVILMLAIWRALALARRFSEPIEQLVSESDRISRGNFQQGVEINSNVAEVRRLAAAHEHMRVGLKSLMKLEGDLQLARQIQQNTFPDELPRLPGLDIAAWSEPAEETGGDMYDIIGYVRTEAGQPLVLSHDQANRAVLMLADATGHGIGPALSVTQLRAMLRMAVRIDGPPDMIFQQINEQLCLDLPENRFITAWMGELNATNFTLRSFSAGQGPLLWYRASLDTFETVDVDSPPLGILPNLKLGLNDPIQLEPGDFFAVISDGIFESVNSHREMVGRDRVCEMIRRNRKHTAEQVSRAIRRMVEEFTGGAAAADDRTLIIIKREKR